MQCNLRQPKKTWQWERTRNKWNSSTSTLAASPHSNSMLLKDGSGTQPAAQTPNIAFWRDTVGLPASCSCSLLLVMSSCPLLLVISPLSRSPCYWQGSDMCLKLPTLFVELKPATTKLHGQRQLLLLCSDGVWEFMTPMEATRRNHCGDDGGRDEHA